MKGTVYATQIRMSEELHQRVMRIVEQTGDTINGTILHMILLGLKVYESPITVHFSDSSES